MYNDILREYEIMLNPALGAYAIYSFCEGFYERNISESNRITLYHLAVIFPLIFNTTSREVILKKQERSGLRSILSRDTKLNILRNEVIFSMDKRIEGSYKRTMRSINVSVASGLILIDDGHFHPIGKVKIPRDWSDETKGILKAAQKLGKWAGTMSVVEYLNTLGVGMSNEARNSKIGNLAD